MTIETDIITALFDAAEAFKPTLNLPFSYPNVVFPVPNDQKYVEVKIFPNVTSGPTWGNDQNHIGVFQLTLHWSNNDGLINPGEIVGKIAAAFAKGSVFYSGAAAVKIEAPPWIMTPIVDGQSLIFPVSIPYRCAN